MNEDQINLEKPAKQLNLNAATFVPSFAPAQTTDNDNSEDR